MSNISKENPPSEEFENLPKSIGPYEIKEKINEGEFSKIYLGISKYTTDKVAIKIINKSLLMSNPDDLLLIKNEIEVLKLLKHRNILTLYEIYESSQYIFLITEYLPSDLLSLILNKKRLSESDALKIFIQLIDAFQYMHKLQIGHRDFRLEHIMLDSNNIPKIIDFGFATFYKKGEHLEEPYGSLSYACPEIIQQKPYEPELADVWSLGVCLYVMVCGYLPFSEEDDKKNNELIIQGKVEYPDEIGNICKDLLKKMLEVDTKKRINLLKITRHPWIKGCKDIKIIGGYNFYDMIYPIDERLINIIKEYGIDTKKLEEDLNNNKYNNITGLFKLITKKTLSLGYGSTSDFTSNSFVEYMKKKDKIKSDGNNKYNEFLKKIEEKNNEIKKTISSYKLKQEDVIKQLEELKNQSIKEEKENKTDEKSFKNIINNVVKLKRVNDFIKMLTKNFEQETDEINNELDKKNKKRKNSLSNLAKLNEVIKENNNNGIKSRNKNNLDLNYRKSHCTYRRIPKIRLRRTSVNPSSIELLSRKPKKENNKTKEIIEEKKVENDNNKSINSNKDKKEQEKAMKSIEKNDKDEKSENKEDNDNDNNQENEEDENKDKKEMRFSLSFDDDEDKEKSDNEDNNYNDNKDEEKSNDSNESKEKEISLKENNIEENEIEKETPKKKEKEENIQEDEKEKHIVVNEVPEKKEEIKEKEKKIVAFDHDLFDSKFAIINCYNLGQNMNKIDIIRVKHEEEKEKEKVQDNENIIKKNDISENNEYPIKNNKIDNNIKEIKNNDEDINKIQKKQEIEIKKKEKEELKEELVKKEEKDTIPTEYKETLQSKEKEIINSKNEDILENNKMLIKENENYLLKEKSKLNKKTNSKKPKDKKVKDKKDVIKPNKEKEEIVIEKENKNEDNEIKVKQNKTIIKNKKQNKDKPDKNVKNNDKDNKINIIEKKENENNYLLLKSKKLNHKQKGGIKQENDKRQKLEINNNIIKETMSINSPENKNTKEKDNEKIHLRSNKPHNKKEKNKLNDIDNIKTKKESQDKNINVEHNEIIHNKNLVKEKAKQIIKSNGKIEEKEKDHSKETYLVPKKRSIDLDKKLQKKLKNMNIEKISKPKDKPMKFETITQYKEKQENKSHSKKKTIQIQNQDYHQSITRSQKSRNKYIGNKNKEDTFNFGEEKSKSLKSSTKNKNISERNNYINQDYELSPIGVKNTNNEFTISHVNDINYFGDNYYLYLKNRILRINNNKLNNNINKEEHKYNKEYFNDNGFIGYNLYLNTESEKKRKVMFSDNKNSINDNDMTLRQKKLERQKNKLKEELRKTGNGKYLYKKNSNNNPINRKEKNKNVNSEKQKIKIVNKVFNDDINLKHNNKNERKPNLLNKKEKYEKNSNDQYTKLSSIDISNNNYRPKEFNSPVSVNTKLKNDPFKYITQYYLAKDKLNKLTNNKHILEDEKANEYNKYKNINFLEILKLINEAKRNDLENKLSKFKGKQESPVIRKINLQNYQIKSLSHTIDNNNIINTNNNNSLLKAYHNNHLRSMDFITENNNNSITMTRENNFRQRSNDYTAPKKHKHKRVISLVKNKKKRDESFGNAERRLNSSKRMCRVCNKSYRDNVSTEHNRASSAINVRYNRKKSNSVCKKIKKVNINQE